MIFNNNKEEGGGGMKERKMIIRESEFEGNGAEYRGGAMFLFSSSDSVLIFSSSFT